MHLAVLAVVATFLRLGWWQLDRAAAGNLLSYGYAIQWPAFAVFVVWVWVVEMRKAVRTNTDAAPAEQADEQTVRAEPTVRAEQPRRRRRPRNDHAYDDSDDPALAAYNHYLAWRNAHPHATPADYPGMPFRPSSPTQPPEMPSPTRKVEEKSS